MTRRDWAYLAIRMLAIVLVIEAVRQLADVFSFSLPVYMQVIERDSAIYEVGLVIAIPALLMIAGSIVMWRYTDKLANILLPAHPQEAERSLQVKHIEGFVLALVGLVLVVWSLPILIRLGLAYRSMTDERLLLEHNRPWLSIAEHGLRFVIGLLLLWKAEGGARLLRKIRGNA